MKSLLNGLVSYWPLHAASGTRYDATGQGNNLTDNNTVTQNPGIVDNAAQFTNATSEFLSLATNASVETGDIDYTIGCWVYLDNKATIQGIITKDDAAAQREFGIKYRVATDRFEWDVFIAGDTAKTVKADALGSPSTATWYFLLVWHDSANNLGVIEANASLQDTVATTAALQAAQTSNFIIGGYDGSLYLDGRICEVAMWKRLLAQRERSWLYNNGQGRTWPLDGRPAVNIAPPSMPIAARRYRQQPGYVY